MPTATNLKPIPVYVEEIRQHLSNSTDCWRAIASAFAEAKEMYGGDSDSFRQLYKETGFSKSTAYKLANIMESERLQQYREKLSSVSSWGTLYAIASLSDEKFAVLCEKYGLNDPDKEPPFLTQSMISAVRKEKREAKKMKVFATIYVDEEAMKAGLFDGEHVEDLNSVLDELRKTLPHMKITYSGVDEKVESKFFQDVQHKRKELARKAFSQGLKALWSRHTKFRGEKKADYELRVVGETTQSLWNLFNDVEVDAFDLINAEYDPVDLQQKAIDEVTKKKDKLAEQVRIRTSPYLYANADPVSPCSSSLPSIQTPTPCL